jgi:ribosomal subunit interface protein
MRIQIRSRDVEVTEDLRDHVERRLGFALGRFGERIGLVIVRFSDGSAALDASVKRCQIDVALRPRHVDAEDIDTDVREAVNHAAHRVSRSVARLLDQENER